jgi:hypothetical protein
MFKQAKTKIVNVIRVYSKWATFGIAAAIVAAIAATVGSLDQPHLVFAGSHIVIGGGV